MLGTYAAATMAIAWGLASLAWRRSGQSWPLGVRGACASRPRFGEGTETVKAMDTSRAGHTRGTRLTFRVLGAGPWGTTERAPQVRDRAGLDNDDAFRHPRPAGGRRRRLFAPARGRQAARWTRLRAWPPSRFAFLEAGHDRPAAERAGKWMDASPVAARPAARALLGRRRG